eukprot:6480165-Amphidinium_carterae.1
MDCSTTHLRGWKHLAWPEFVATCKNNEEMKAAVVQAKAFLKGSTKRSFPVETMEENRQMGLMLQTSFDFMTIAEFESTFGLKPDKVDLPVFEFIDEGGEKVAGVTMGPPRRQLHMQSFLGTDWSRQLMQAESQIRPGQGEDFQKWWAGDRQRSTSTNLSKKSRAEVEEAVAKKKESMKREGGATEAEQPPLLE